MYFYLHGHFVLNNFQCFIKINNVLIKSYKLKLNC